MLMRRQSSFWMDVPAPPSALCVSYLVQIITVRHGLLTGLEDMLVRMRWR